MRPAGQRTIRRRAGRNTITVETRHPTYGWLVRGTIRALPNPRDPHARLLWPITDQDSFDVARHIGDYLDAEQILLANTTWADEPA